MEFQRADMFRTVWKPFKLSSRQLCPACFIDNAKSTYPTVAFGYSVLALAAVPLYILFPTTFLGPLVLNATAILVFSLVCTVMHELGHAVAGWWAGVHMFGIDIGSGRVVNDFSWGGLRWRLRQLPFGGCAIGMSRETCGRKFKNIVFTMGGPLANALILLVAANFVVIDNSLEATFLGGFVPVQMLILTNGVMLLSSLWPFRARSVNDIQLAWRVWRMGKAEIDQLPAAYYAYQAAECQRTRQYADAAKWIAEGLQRFPTHETLGYLEAENLSRLRRFREARRAWSLLLKKLHHKPEWRALLLNNLADNHLFSREDGWLVKADTCSRLALKQSSKNAYYKCTRGAVLLELGRYDEALELLHQAFAGDLEPAAQAQNACFIAKAEMRRGNIAESRNYVELARKLDPHCVALDA